MTRLTDRQRHALTVAAAAWDRSLTNVDMRVVRHLADRGLVDIITGTDSYYSHRKGWWVTRSVVVDVKINAAGLSAIGRG